MDTPAGADDCLLVLHHQMLGFRGRAHKMEYHVILRNIDIGVNLHAALVGMYGHGIPYAARLQNRQAHGKLAGFQHIRVDKLIDHSLVGGLQAAERLLCGVGDPDKRCFIRAVSRSAHHKEFCRIRFVLAGKGNAAGAHGNIQAVLAAHGKTPAVGLDHARSANIKNTDFSSLQKEFGAKAGPNVDPLVDGKRFPHGHASQGHHTVHMAVYRNDFVRHIQVLDQELRPQLIRCIPPDVSLIGRVTNIHKKLPFSG